MDWLIGHMTPAIVVALIIQVIIVVFKIEKIERMLLNERKKLLIDFSMILSIGFIISLILYRVFHDPSCEGLPYYIVILVQSCLLSIFIYWNVVSTFRDRGFGNNYYFEDEQYGKLYIIKRSFSRYLLLADKPREIDRAFSVFENESFILGKKIYVESKKMNFSFPGFVRKKKEVLRNKTE